MLDLQHQFCLLNLYSCSEQNGDCMRIVIPIAFLTCRTIFFAMFTASLALRGHRLGYRLGQLVGLIYGRVTRGALQLGLVWDFLLLARFPFFQISWNTLLLLLCLLLPPAVPMRKVYCVGYTPRAWDPRSLQSMLNDYLYLGL